MAQGLALEATINGQGVLLGSLECLMDDLCSGRLIRCYYIGFQDGCFRLITGEGSARRKSIQAFRSWLLDETASLRGGSLEAE